MLFTRSALTLVVCLLCLSTFAQIKFDPGYIITHDNKKTDCLIEYKEWLDNPGFFLYKLNDKDEPKKGTPADVKEFGIDAYSKYVGVSVQLDTSNTFIIARYSDTRHPSWATKRVFLRSVVEGSANLYSYQNGDILAFFFSSAQDSVIRQLVHKNFYTREHKVAENLEYQQQLINNVLCGDNMRKRFANMRYQKRDLRKYFIEYNTCKGDVVVPVIQQETQHQTIKPVRKGFLNLTLTPGISYSSMSVRDKRDSRWIPVVDFDFEDDLLFRLGLEMEYTLPFMKNTLSIFIEPTFQSFEGTGIQNRITAGTIEYKSIELPLGFRYRSYLKKGNMFFNLVFIPGPFIDLTDSRLVVMGSVRKIDPTMGFSFGAGYMRGRFSTELRYYIPQNLVSDEPDYHARYQRLVLIGGFRFLELRKKS